MKNGCLVSGSAKSVLSSWSSLTTVLESSLRFRAHPRKEMRRGKSKPRRRAILSLQLRTCKPFSLGFMTGWRQLTDNLSGSFQCSKWHVPQQSTDDPLVFEIPFERKRYPDETCPSSEGEQRRRGKCIRYGIAFGQ